MSKLISKTITTTFYKQNKKKLNLEEVLTHALIRATAISSSRELSYVLLVIAKNRKKLNVRRLFETARDHGIEGSAKQCIEFVDAALTRKEIKKPLEDFVTIGKGMIFPDESEFKELLKQYGI